MRISKSSFAILELDFGFCSEGASVQIMRERFATEELAKYSSVPGTYKCDAEMHVYNDNGRTLPGLSMKMV